MATRGPLSFIVGESRCPMLFTWWTLLTLKVLPELWWSLQEFLIMWHISNHAEWYLKYIACSTDPVIINCLIQCDITGSMGKINVGKGSNFELTKDISYVTVYYWDHCIFWRKLPHYDEIKLYIMIDSYRADSRLAPSQWETSLQSNAIFHWLGAHLESALSYDYSTLYFVENWSWL